MAAAVYHKWLLSHSTIVTVHYHHRCNSQLLLTCQFFTLCGYISITIQLFPGSFPGETVDLEWKTF